MLSSRPVGPNPSRFGTEPPIFSVQCWRRRDAQGSWMGHIWTSHGSVFQFWPVVASWLSTCCFGWWCIWLVCPCLVRCVLFSLGFWRRLTIRSLRRVALVNGNDRTSAFLMRQTSTHWLSFCWRCFTTRYYQLRLPECSSHDVPGRPCTNSTAVSRRGWSVSDHQKVDFSATTSPVDFWHCTNSLEGGT